MNICKGCGAPTESLGSGKFKCTYCGTQTLDTSAGRWETNQAINTSVGLLARKAAKEEIKELESELKKITAESIILETAITELSSRIYDNSTKRIAPWRIWGLLIGIGSFFQWYPLFSAILIGTSTEASELTETLVLACAAIAAFLSGQLYRQLTIRKRRKATSVTALGLNGELEVHRIDKRILEQQQKELTAQIGELRGIAEGSINNRQH